MFFCKGQSSFEFLVLISFVFAAFAFGLFFIFDYFNDSVDDFKVSRLESLGRSIVESSEALSVRGAGSRSSFSFKAPISIVDFSDFSDELFLIEYLEGGVLKNISVPLKFDVRFFGNFKFNEDITGVVSLETYDFGDGVFVVATPFSRCDPGASFVKAFSGEGRPDIDLNSCSDVTRSNPGSDLEWFSNLCFYFDSNNDCSLSPNEVTQGETALNSLPTFITTPRELFDVRDDLSGSYFLGSDIDLSDFNDDGNADNGNWLPIGSSSAPFTGSFDGKGFSITGLNVSSSSQRVGLFGFVNNSNISNVSITGSVTSTTHRVGGLTGIADNSNISYVSFSGNVSSGGWHVGGLIGRSDNGLNVSFSSSSGMVNSSYGNVGGLVGYVRDGGVVSFSSSSSSVNSSAPSDDRPAGGLVGSLDISSEVVVSFASGSVSGSSEVGGLVGRLNADSNISDSFASGTVSGLNNLGGLVGTLRSRSHISDSFSFGAVVGSGSSIGGLVGRNDQSTSCSVQSYWNTDTSGVSSRSGCPDSRDRGKTTSELQRETSAAGIYSSWDADIWDFGSSSEYPRLRVFG